MRYFSLDRIKSAIEHLQEYDSKWVIVPLVFAVNGVGEEEPVRVQGAGKAATDRFLDEYFNGKLMGLPDFDNGANTLRPRFEEIETGTDFVLHQRQKLWGSQYSRNGYNIMRDRSLIDDPGTSTWQILPNFWDAWKWELSDDFAFEELLVWLYAFSGFDDVIDSWEELAADFQERHLGEGNRFPDGYEARFRIDDEVSWPDDLLTARPSNEEFQRELMPSLAGPARDEDWLRERFEEWRKKTGYTEADAEHALESRREFAELLSEESLADPESFDLPLFRRFAADNYGDPGNQSQILRFLNEEGEDGVERLTATLSHLLYGEADVATRIDEAVSDSNLKVTGLSEALLTKALAVVHHEEWLPIFVYKSDTGKGKRDILQVLHADLPDGDTLSMGEAAVLSDDALLDRVDPLLPGDRWGQMNFLWWLRTYSSDSAALAAELLLEESWIEEVGELLDDKRQVIFYGPPGTGKTYVAQRLAEWYAAEGEVEMVQFHPSYTYEDFVQGYRPTKNEKGELSFELEPGPLLRLAEAAKDGGTYVLLVDEINRGNIAKIFGELYFLLEYRDKAIRLQYGDDFELPENLVVIGTMNTADRSIAFIDAALRRRFHFVPFFPDREPVEGLLRRWLLANNPDMVHVADLLDRTNELLDDRDFQIGPAHFMTSKLDDRWLGKIWTYSVIPYLEEHFYEEPERVKAFELKGLLAEIEAKGTEEDGEPDAGAEGVETG